MAPRKYKAKSINHDEDLIITDNGSERSTSTCNSSSKGVPSLIANLSTSSDSSLSSYKNPPFSARLFLPSVLVFMTFVFGISTGVAYAGWVQHRYGHVNQPVLERFYRPFGPSTTGRVSAGSSTTRKKKLQLNRDNPQLKKPVLSTLFGIEYTNVVVPTGRTVDPEKESIDSKPPRPDAGKRIHISPEWYRLASTPPVPLTQHQLTMIQEVATRVHHTIPGIHERARQVSWGGPQNKAIPETNWWFRVGNSTSTSNGKELSDLDGGHLLYAYLHIMKWEARPHFPFRLCAADSCPPERAIAHSLEWREKYQPWLAPPTLLEENSQGYSYHRGFSPSSQGKHATVWLRLGHHVRNDLTFFRGILHSADRAIADALIESKGETGKFNVIIDCAGFSLSHAPTIAALKQGVTMLQDHFPNRLGMIHLVHLSRPGQIFLNIVLRIITKEVRDKIKILSQPKSLAILKTVVEEQYIPDWLGGPDTYRFHADEYYPPHHRCTEEEAREFLNTMPYHAK